MSVSYAPIPFLDTRTVFRCGDIELVTTRWEPSQHTIRRTACPRYDAIEFMRVGCFAKRTSSRWTLTDANAAAIFRRNREFEVDHPTAKPTQGTTLRFHSDSLEQLVRDGLGVSRPDFEAARDLGERPTSPRCHILHRSMVQLCADGMMDSMLFMDTLRATIAPVFAAQGARTPASADLPLRHAEHRRLQSIRELIQVRLPRTVHLKELADHLGCSEPYVCRWFHARAGIPLHRYVLRLRLRLALERLAANESLSSLALRCGFSSHSHLTTSFRREFGLSPSIVRDAWKRHDLRALRCAADDVP